MSGEHPTDAQERHARATALFDAALDLPDSERDAFIASATAGSATLAADVRLLLLASARLDGFLERSPVLDAGIRPLQSALSDRYAIRERIARGGMATLYRADDLRHGRQVAIKVLAAVGRTAGGSTLSQQRFLDEIRVTARLQHAHVLPLFDSGTAAGLLYYVMPFIEGETLRQHLRHTGPLALEDALTIVRGIAGALDHAHASGIVHRDLKPENILLRDGQPLVCDFGIALATAGLDDERRTEPGVVIGTPQYMSPEQASGAAVIDARTDVYALGAMLYEMLVGDPPHMASSSHGILAKVRAERPTAVSTLREGISLPVSQVVDRALAKLPVDRYPSARAFVAALEEASRTPSTAATTGRRRASRTAFGVTAGVAIIVTATLAARRPTAPGDAEPATRFVVTPIADAAIGRAPSITPDGSALVYAGSAQSDRRLFIRRVNELAARALPGTSGALDTWISPDGTRIAFTTTDDRVKVIGWDGSRLRDVAGVFRYSNVAWLNDSVLVVDSYGQGGLAWIAAEGGALRPLTQLDTLRHDSAHGIPLALGDGTGIIFVVSRNRAGPGAQSGELSLVRHERGATHAVAYTPIGLQASEAIAYIDGWLLYVTPDGRSLMAARFDAARAVVTGVPVPVLEQDGGGLEHVMLARNGTLLYTRRVRPNNAPVLVDLHGVATPVMRGLSGAFMNPRVSPDGRRIAVQGATSQGNDAWLYDIATGTQTRLTQSGSVLGPAWSADGRQLVYVSPRDGQDAIWSSDVDGRENATRLVVAAGAFGASPARTGSVVLFQRRTLGVWSIWQAPLQVGAPPTLVVDGASDAFMPSLSPDGHWLTYASSESGRYEIYLRPFPGPGNSVRVSRDGGTEPAWSTDGRRIYFRADRRLLAATIGAGTAPTVIERRVLFADVFDGDMPMPHRNYDVLPDGKGFVMIAPVDSAAPETIVVLNWLGEMRARLAAQRPP